MVLYEGGPDIPLLNTYTTKKYFVGSKFPTKHWGLITIIGKVNKPTLKNDGRIRYRHFVVQFEDGTRVVAMGTNINRGEVQNPNHPSVHGVGFIGQGKHKPCNNGCISRTYSVWVGMIKRCYSKCFLPTYKDCTVDERWHNFQNFAEDITKIPRYEEWLENKNNNMDLDKDIRVPGNKIYSLETCMFVTRSENSSDALKRRNLTGLTYIGTRLSDGYEEEFTNQKEFGERHNFNGHGISSCIRGKQHTSHGWKFRVKEEQE